MQFRTVSAAATLVIGALVTSATALSPATGPANAQPAAAPEPAAPSLAYSAKLVDKTVVTTLEGGTFELSRTPAAPEPGALPVKPVDVVNVKDGDGKVLLTLPLVFHLGPIDIPVKPEVQKDGTVLALTPDKPSGLSFNQPIAVKPVASELENNRALNYFITQFSLATSIGTFVGTAIGATIGCVVTLVAGCIPGLTTGAAAGGIIGTIALGGPTLIISGIDLLTTMNSPDGTTKWADKTTTAPTPAAPQPGS
ncbi:hypothetical protein [Nocardia seriolae]|uniref:DUF8020 domain-containing protein n=1 Tax=Nocardia seriolae TaxID=37332 RepID=A0ABC9YPY9_9NOCA|nr:hypothetical protein [Nocardia seriolae]APB00923.1 hypothetical protein NS506_06892 [Nocardia seriolae]WNJ60876.1 hypothetical protein RMO66_09290 [Nocardia seriolae]BEK86032.1 hypothetical protein NSERKGN1266_19830 [Nocardia seriolae]BEK98034.1 hypothetical protein NSER024013_59400 [Nocardia seriolae]GAM45479.1 hypothetical protein NS07_v2contig00016-0005 [Nocardia seriolae]